MAGQGRPYARHDRKSSNRLKRTECLVLMKYWNVKGDPMLSDEVLTSQE